jgi:hypothetical protein
VIEIGFDQRLKFIGFYLQCIQNFRQKTMGHNAFIRERPTSGQKAFRVPNLHGSSNFT